MKGLIKESKFLKKRPLLSFGATIVESGLVTVIGIVDARHERDMWHLLSSIPDAWSTLGQSRLIGSIVRCSTLQVLTSYNRLTTACNDGIGHSRSVLIKIIWVFHYEACASVMANAFLVFSNGRCVWTSNDCYLLCWNEACGLVLVFFVPCYNCRSDCLLTL